MTVQEFYNLCKSRNATNYQIKVNIYSMLGNYCEKCDMEEYDTFDIYEQKEIIEIG